MIFSKRMLRVNAAVLSVWSLITFVGALSTTILLIACGIERSLEIDYFPRYHPYNGGAKCFTILMVFLVILSCLQLRSSIILYHGISKERVQTINSWSACYTILTAILTNVPMTAAILCFLNSADDQDFLFIVGTVILGFGLIHTGQAAVFTMNLKFHFEENCEDSSPLLNEESTTDDWTRFNIQCNGKECNKSSINKLQQQYFLTQDTVLPCKTS